MPNLNLILDRPGDLLVLPSRVTALLSEQTEHTAHGVTIRRVSLQVHCPRNYRIMVEAHRHAQPVKWSGLSWIVEETGLGRVNLESRKAIR